MTLMSKSTFKPLGCKASKVAYESSKVPFGIALYQIATSG